MNPLTPIRTLLLVLTLASSVCAQSDPLLGRWGGWLDVSGSRSWFQLAISRDQVVIEDFNTMRGGQLALDVEREGGSLRLVYPAPAGRFVLTGAVEGRDLEGGMEGEHLAARFHLHRFHAVDEEQLAEQIGCYRDGEGRAVWLLPRTFGGLRLVSYENDGTRFGDYSFDGLLPWKRGSYFEGNLTRPSLPPSTALHFVGDRIEAHGAWQLDARRDGAGRVRRVSFSSGDHTLYGFLMFPPGPGPHPAIAYAHGSGYVSADSPFDLYHSVRMVRSLGVAVLRWDKQGVGASGGDQGLASYHDLADDIEAAAAWLRRQPDIDPDRVGIGGLSQAPSWPIPVVAARVPETAFVIATSGSVTTAVETNLFNWGNRMRTRGIEESQIEEFAAFFRDFVPYTLDPSPAGQAAIDGFLADYRDAPWYPMALELAGVELPVDSPIADRWRRIHAVDPLASWAEVHCPVFQTWGADDPLVDAKGCAERMRDLVERTGQENFTSIVYPSPADHAVGSASTPTFFTDLRTWFRDRVLGGAGKDEQ